MEALLVSSEDWVSEAFSCSLCSVKQRLSRRSDFLPSPTKSKKSKDSLQWSSF